MTAEEIMKKNIPNGIVNVKAIGKGAGKPQYRAEVDAIVKCMEEYAEQEVKNISSKQDVSGRSELLIDFIKWLQKEYEVQEVYEMYADEYLQEKSINSH